MISQFLMDNYYARYTGDKDIVPTKEQIDQAIANYPDKMVTIGALQIEGVAFFLTLTDETYAKLESIDISDLDTLKSLCLENGKNVHFVLVCGSGVRNILRGIKKTIERVHPKSISWWEPDFSYLHRYNMN